MLQCYALATSVSVTTTEGVAPVTVPETWTLEDVDEWLAEAHDTLRRLHVRDRGPAGLRSSMPEPVPEPWLDALNRVELGIPHNLDNWPAPPSTQAIAHLDQVDRWLRWLTVEQRWVVRWRSAGLSWRQVSRSYWRDREGVSILPTLSGPVIGAP